MGSNRELINAARKARVVVQETLVEAREGSRSALALLRVFLIGSAEDTSREIILKLSETYLECCEKEAFASEDDFHENDEKGPNDD